MSKLNASDLCREQGYNLEHMLQLDNIELNAMDELTYSICLTSWDLIIRDCTARLGVSDAPIHMHRMIRTLGLIKSIEYAQDCANDLLHGLKTITNPITQCLEACGIYKLSKETLLMLRFPKRLSITPIGCDEGYNDYLALNTLNGTKYQGLYPWDCNHKLLLTRVKERVAMFNDILKSQQLYTQLKSDTYDTTLWLCNKWDVFLQNSYFSSGATPIESSIPNKSLAVKTLAVFGTNDPMRGACVPDISFKDVAIAVPKAYNKKRIICENDITRNYMGQTLRKLLCDCFSTMTQSRCWGYYNPDDQNHSCEMVLRGSRTRSICTIDLSSASDSIGHDLPWILGIDGDFLAMCEAVRATTLNVGRVKTRNNIWFTSGASLCFNFEMVVFSIIVEAAIDDFETWAKNFDPKFRKFSRTKIAIYGDDIIIPDECYEIVCEYLTLFGFKVNDTKSYAHDSKFRESCGLDAYDGTVVSSLYFPRKNYRTQNSEFLLSLCKLQQHAMLEGMLHTGFYLADVLKGLGINPLPFRALIEEEKVIATYLPGVTFEYSKSPYAIYGDAETIETHWDVVMPRDYTRWIEEHSSLSKDKLRVSQTTSGLMRISWDVVNSYPSISYEVDYRPDNAFINVQTLVFRGTSSIDNIRINSNTYETSSLLEAYNMYCYYNFLLHGSLVDEVIGCVRILSNRISLAQFCGLGKEVVSTTSVVVPHE